MKINIVSITRNILRKGVLSMRNAFRIFRRDMKRLLRNPAAILVLIGVSILPSLYAWFNIAANIDPYANTSGIKVAVANLDTDATHDDLTINAGSQIIDQLKENDQLDGHLSPKMLLLKESNPVNIMQLSLFRKILANPC